MPAVEKRAYHNPDQVTGPALNGEVVVPHDANELAFISRALYVGTAGNVKVLLMDGTSLTINAVAAGTLLPIRVKRVDATGTTASNITALY